MIQEHKELLLKDLSARLPYGVKIDNMGEPSMLTSINKKYRVIVEIAEVDKNSNFNPTRLVVLEIEDAKPYLFPLSSMTEEQEEEYQDLLDNQYSFDANGNIFTLQDFYCKYHLDYRGLIPIGAAIDATNKNIY